MTEPKTLSDMLRILERQVRAHALAGTAPALPSLYDLAVTLGACAQAAADMEEDRAARLPPILPPNVVRFPLRAAR